MTGSLGHLIGKTRLEITQYGLSNNIDIEFSLTRGHKDTDILNEEYAVRAKYKEDRIQVVLSVFKTAI